jgi:hypothetical protein
VTLGPGEGEMLRSIAVTKGGQPYLSQTAGIIGTEPRCGFNLPTEIDSVEGLMSTMKTFAAIPPLSKDSGSWAPKGLSFPLLNVHVCGSLQSRRGMMSGAAATDNLDKSGINRVAPEQIFDTSSGICCSRVLWNSPCMMSSIPNITSADEMPESSLGADLKLSSEPPSLTAPGLF